MTFTQESTFRKGDMGRMPSSARGECPPLGAEQTQPPRPLDASTRTPKAILQVCLAHPRRSRCLMLRPKPDIHSGSRLRLPVLGLPQGGGL
jgi:hypothetical protein